VGSNSERKCDVRIVAATHRDLRERVIEGQFREDLLYRLDVISIDLPALRHRRDDIPLLVESFLAEARQRYPNATLRRLAPAVIEKFMTAPWRGNVRELKHVVERLVVLCRSEVATTADLPKSMLAEAPGASEPLFGDRVMTIREMQRSYANWALQRFSGAKMLTCEALGIDSKTLAKWLRPDNSGDKSS
jgi:two-component system response regulator HydG